MDLAIENGESLHSYDAMAIEFLVDLAIEKLKTVDRYSIAICEITKGKSYGHGHSDGIFLWGDPLVP